MRERRSGETVLARLGADITLLLADHRLAGKATGVDLATFAKQQFPETPVVVVSGDPSLPLPPNVRFLQKPYRASQLLGS